MRSLTIYSFLFAATLPIFTGCNPKIYSFTVDPLSTGQNDSVRVSWNVKGKPTLLIHDINYPGSGTGELPALTLLIWDQGSTTAFPLSTFDTINLPLASSEGSLTIRKKPDSITSDRLRYITLVVSRNGKEVPRGLQIAVRPDSASDEIGYRVSVKGDTLVAAGPNNSKRWGNNFDILTVTDGSNREMEVIHANISRVLHPGDPPDASFKATPVQGNWMFRSLLTPEEKNNPMLIPAALMIHIIIKHH